MSAEDREGLVRPIPRGATGKAYESGVKRTAAKFQTFFAVVWVGLAVLRWFFEGPSWLTWAWTALAVAATASAAFHWRRLGRDQTSNED